MTGSYDSDGGGLSYSDDEGERQIVWPSPMAEASKLGGGPADDRAAIDDTNAGPWYQRRLPLTEPKAWMIFGMAFFGMPLVGLCALSLLQKIYLLRDILEVLPEAGSSKKTLAGGEGKGAPSSA